MSFFAHCLNILPGMQWLSLPEEVDVFGQMMNQQLDLRHEADNLLTFESNFAPRKVPVSFSRPLKMWSTKDLLVEEYMNALPLEAFLLNGGGPFDDQIATIGLDAFLVSFYYYWTCGFLPLAEHAPSRQLCSRRLAPRQHHDQIQQTTHYSSPPSKHLQPVFPKRSISNHFCRLLRIRHHRHTPPFPHQQT